jgi:hypothetical protein
VIHALIFTISSAEMKMGFTERTRSMRTICIFQVSEDRAVRRSDIRPEP